MGRNRLLVGGCIAASAFFLLTAACSVAYAEFVTVAAENPTNSPETHANGVFGAVPYTYDIGKYEVTAGEYVDFLNTVATASDSYGLYNAAMTGSYGCKIQQSGTPGSYSYSVNATYANRPVNFVSWYDAARYCNWLTSGDTESGAYQFDASGDFTGINRVVGLTVALDGLVYTLPTEDEWYKAAYYDPTRSGTDKYWFYPTQSDSVPGKDLDDTSSATPGNNANYYNATQGAPYLTEVGEFELSASYYETFDQGGNVTEWTETLNGNEYVFRGGSWLTDEDEMRAENRNDHLPSVENDHLGFRVVALTAAAIPEPSTVMLLLVAAMAGLVRRRR